MDENAGRTRAHVGATVLGVVLLIALYLGFSSAMTSIARDMAHRMSASALAGEGAAESGSASTVAYVSELAAASGAHAEVEAAATFDDAWLLASPRVYNSELAQTCAVLAAACNSQSLHDARDGRAYAEDALRALGFRDIDTRSYQGRSTVFDELANIAEGETDVVAYTLATKELVTPRGGCVGNVVFVGVRGTYGSEWLSNFNFDIGSTGASSAASPEHRGFSAASDEVRAALADYLLAHNLDPRITRVLVCGHSRGGAVANLLAASLIDEAGEGAGVVHVPAENVFAYTFAAPNATRSEVRGDVRYQGIFNIANPSDVVVRLPFAQWGYGVYGTTVELPQADDVSFDVASTLASHCPDAYVACLARSRDADLAFFER